MEWLSLVHRMDPTRAMTAVQHVPTGIMVLRLPAIFGHVMSAVYKKGKNDWWTGLRLYVTEEEVGKYTGGTCTIFGKHTAEEGKGIF